MTMCICQIIRSTHLSLSLSADSRLSVHLHTIIEGPAIHRSRSLVQGEAMLLLIAFTSLT